ncbi:cysteine hydrolase family protein [Diaminobutyricibacter sp. McL0608]|uniref:cysteine hydrolase family protein n=1 Tax=Leifsonia sp. McL0608 TaxID=3143537 RepID=UPI0031F30826
MNSLDTVSTALLIMDVQPSIVAQVPDADAFVDGLLRAREAARAADLTVGYVRVALTEDDIAAVPASNVTFHAAAATGRMLDGPDTQVDARIAPADDEIVVRKSRVGAFSTTDLREQLLARGVDTLVLCGISTSGVVLSTVRDGADHDFRIVVLEDGCFDRDPEVHRVLTEKIFPRQAEVVSIDDFVAAL